MVAMVLVMVNVRTPILSQDVIGQVRAHEAVAELCGSEVVAAPVGGLLEMESVLADSLRRRAEPDWTAEPGVSHASGSGWQRPGPPAALPT